MPKKTPLNKIHKQLGARMVDFAGWEMPVQYAGIREEHMAVRQKAGLFDVSHMGEIEIRGPEAEAIAQKLTCNDVSRLKVGDCQYSAFLTEAATFIDDIIVNKLASDRFLICINASNIDKDYEWVRSHATAKTVIENRSDGYFQIALQGPEASQILAGVAKQTVLPEKPFTVVPGKLAGRPVWIARTGYTGEDGFEFYGDPKEAEAIWSLLIDAGVPPCGLAARDTLRLEAAYPLYGHEIDDTIHPYEARLGWIVKIRKGDFIGSGALQKMLGSSLEILLEKLLVGIQMVEPGIARQGGLIYGEEEETGPIGTITSGTKSPLLDTAIALGYVKTSFAEVGTKIEIDIHNKKREAVVVSLPFYKRPI